MKVALLTPSISRQAGGMMDCVRRPAQELSAAPGLALDVFARDDADAAADRPAWEPVRVHLYPGAGPAGFGYARGLGAGLARANPDLVHTHGLWTYLSVAGRAWHRRTRRPYLVTPHGMLDPWAVNNSRWKKRLAAGVFERGHLRGAACLHALCEAEAAAIRAYGLTNPVCVIPNGVDLPAAADAPSAAPWAGRVPDGGKVLLYLGRLHPKKGLPALLRAWADARSRRRSPAEPWHLVVAGWDQGGHAAELRQLATGLGIAESCLFIGPAYGEAKAGAYRHADAFVLPSVSEGLPLTVLEAWAYGLPTLLTPACNLPEGFAAGAAWRADPEPGSLADALDALFRSSGPARAEMGRRGRALVEQRFTWERCSARMAALYAWLLGAGERPASVLG